MPSLKSQKSPSVFIASLVTLTFSLAVLTLVVTNISKKQNVDADASTPNCTTTRQNAYVTNTKGWSKTFKTRTKAGTIDLISTNITGTGFTEGSVSINGQPYIDAFSCGSTPEYGSDCSTFIDVPASSNAIINIPPLTQGSSIKINFQIDECTL